MNTRSFYSGLIRHLSVVTASLGLLAGASAAAAEKTNPPPATSATTTNAAPKQAPIVIPVSQFTIPTTAAEGRNPFFPDSIQTRRPNSIADTNTLGTVTSVALVLQGISGRFALINGRTFEAGEDGDVTVGRSKVHVRCISIREDGVTVEVEGTRRELKLRPGL